jgi:hypothetical protein
VSVSQPWLKVQGETIPSHTVSAYHDVSKKMGKLDNIGVATTDIWGIPAREEPRQEREGGWLAYK